MDIRLYHPNSIVENSTILLSKEHTHYLTNVMRLKRGSFVNFFNKEGEWKSEIIFLEKDRAEVRFLNKVKESQKKNKIELAVCLVKKKSNGNNFAKGNRTWCKQDNSNSFRKNRSKRIKS